MIEALGERRDGTWSAFECALVLGRQNGKNAILEARELAGIVLFGDDLITHTAHRADTALEHFRRMERYAEEFDEFGRLVKHISRTNGREAIELKGGRRITFVSRARDPGRGFSGSCVVFDEALYLNPSTIGAIVPTLATRSMAQVWYTSSAPKASSANLHAVQERGRGDEPDDRLFYAEWGNEPGTDIDDVDGWYQANPGLGIRISEEYVRAERRLMSGDPDLEAEFARERVGIAEQSDDDSSRPIPLDLWGSLAQQSSIGSNFAWSLTVSDDRKWATIGIAGRREDELFHVEVGDNRPTTQRHGDDSSLIDRCVAVWEQERVPVRIHATAPEGSYIAALRERGVEVDEISTAEVARNTGQLIDAANGRLLRHVGQRSLDSSLERADVKSSTSGAVTWVARSGGDDVSPLKAVSVALGGVTQETEQAEEGWVFTT